MEKTQLHIEIDDERIVRIKNKLGIKEDEEKFDVEGAELLQKLKTIDFDLILNYIDMIDKEEIPFGNLYNTFHSIDRQLQKLNRNDEINRQDLEKFEKICKWLLEYLKGQYNKNDETEKRILSVLYTFKYNQKTLEILKSICYSYFIQLFDNERSYQNLIQLLDIFDYFSNKIEDIILNAIDNNKVRFLKDLISNIDFSKHKENRFNFIRLLNKNLVIIENDNMDLKKIIKRIIREFE